MAKNKKKKNYKLRRRVKRTIAALVMIMAIVVAAIPVENYGTMQAADDGTGFKMETEYDADAKTLFSSENIKSADYNEGNYSGDLYVQQISNGVIRDAYKIKTDITNKKAILSGNNGTASIVIGDKEYYDYVMFDDTYISSLKTKIGSNIIITFGEDTTAAFSAISRSDIQVGDDPTNLVTLPQLNNGAPFNCFKEDPNTNSISTDSLSARGYTLDSPVDGIELIKNCESDKYESKVDAIREYNNNVNLVRSAVNKVSNSPADPITQDEYDAWMWLSTNDPFSTIGTLNINANDFSVGQLGLPLVVEYIITNYSKNGTKDLKSFNLAKLTYGGNTVYVPQKKADVSVDTTIYFVDNAGYLANNEIKVVGIESEAFNKNPADIVDVELSSSVKYIGTSAFEGCTNLQSIKINNSNGLEGICDKAFYNSSLAKIELSDTSLGSSLKKIGNRTFANTKLESVSIPGSVDLIGAGAFENMTELTSVNFVDDGNTMEIDAYAFYNCPKIDSVSFGSESKTYKLGKGAFALPSNTPNGMYTFSFPKGNKSIEYSDANLSGCDFILAGRTALSEVTFGSGLNNATIPAQTLRACYNLKDAYFESKYVSYETYDKTANKIVEPQLFGDVTNPAFMVHGPRFLDDNMTDALPLVSTWTAHLGYKVDNKWAPVPYEYIGNDGKTHIELGYDGGDYISTIDVIDGDRAVLSGYKINTAKNVGNERTAITIPAKVGNYKIVEVGDNCFADNIKKKIYKITIEDGHIVSIGANAFSGCENLERVFIGNSVTTIGSRAFADCKALENVYFSYTGLVDYTSDGISYVIGDDDDTWANELLIPNVDAFATKSQRLTFHGAIHSGYRPFEIAMSDNNSDLLDSTSQICYKTDEPLNLTVIRNRVDGKATLVDYPHYQEIDEINSEYIKDIYKDSGHSIIAEFEEKCVASDSGMAKDIDRVIVESALNVELPRGIESIDTKSFFDGATNQNDFDYVRKYYEFNETCINIKNQSEFPSNRIYQIKPYETQIRSVSSGDQKDITKLYSKDGLISDSSYITIYGDEPKVALGGLFSGFYNDNGKEISSDMAQQYALVNNGVGGTPLMDNTYNNHEYKENFNVGNDYITKVKMNNVNKIPAYAFDSCENLLEAVLGESVQEIGELPFRGCKNLYNLVLNNNPNYIAQNLMLFSANGDGKTYTLMECLEGRGKGQNYYSSNVGADDFPETVSNIAESAFINCDNVKVVDLTNTSVTEIPVNCFKHCDSLSEVVLPKTIRHIETGAFVGVSDVLKITVPTSDCVITAGAIDGKSDVTIIGSKYMSDGKTESDLYHSYLTLVKDYGADNVHFADYGNSYKIEFLDRELNTLPGYSYVVEIRDVDKPYNLSAQQIPVSAPQISGFDFVTWLCRVDDVVLSGVKAGDKAFNNIEEDRVYYPSYEPNPKHIVSEGEFVLDFSNATATLVSGSSTIASGTQLKSGQKVEGGATISFIANSKSKFDYWSALGKGTDTKNYNELFSGSTTNYIINFTMPNADVNVEAHMKSSQSGSGGNSSGGDSGNNSGDDSGNKPGGDSNNNQEKKYKLTVNYGSGSGEYKAGDTVTISAFAPESAKKVFSKWTTNVTSVGFASATSATTTFVMPSSDLTVTANYKTRTTDDDDDDDDDDRYSSTRKPGSSSTTTTVTNTTNNAGNNNNSKPGTVTNNNNTNTGTSASDSGDKIYITKNGISNKDVASVDVSGSTDNFIVRISESEEATEAVKQALINKYGTLDGISYLPMDISLYDATGKTKITDTYGLNITVTMPIPDALIQYGGNCRVAAADNGNLQQLTPKFTTIDGIACISFVPPHFSPYVIYVDTNNLVAGQNFDSTPATGDPIHPKWFLAIGMACLSVILFVSGDGRKRRIIRTA